MAFVMKKEVVLLVRGENAMTVATVFGGHESNNDDDCLRGRRWGERERERERESREEEYEK